MMCWLLMRVKRDKGDKQEEIMMRAQLGSGIA
jgi:hypothetical protein